MNTFKLKVVASNKVFFDDECESLIVPVADDGLCGFLANHENKAQFFIFHSNRCKVATPLVVVV